MRECLESHCGHSDLFGWSRLLIWKHEAVIILGAHCILMKKMKWCNIYSEAFGLNFAVRRVHCYCFYIVVYWHATFHVVGLTFPQAKK